MKTTPSVKETQGMDNRICVYAIAKNEAKYAKRWYDSMKEADEVIVLDTGSTDGTPELLRSLGATVYENPYEHFRFDVARNDSLALVPDEYNICVCTDLDELFEPGWAEVVRSQWIDGFHVRALYPYVHDHLDDGSEGFIFNLDKIHARHCGAWRFAVHEVFFSENFTQETCLYLAEGVKLHHYPDIAKSRSNYLNLLRERVEEDPSDALGYLQYGMELQTQGYTEEAIKIYEENLLLRKGSHPSIEIAGMYCHLGECYEKMGNQKQAIINYTSGIVEDSAYRENYYCLARVFLLVGMYDMAIGIAKEGLKTSVRRFHWIEGVFTWAWGLYDILWRSYYEKGQYAEALAYAAAALQTEPGNPDLLEGYSLCLEGFTNN